MATNNSGQAGKVYVTLSTVDSNADTIVFPERRVVLTNETKTVSIGRASKVQSKGFVAAVDNCWFDSPVMSRYHAEIQADIRGEKVHIVDCGSTHGTYLNGTSQRIANNTPQELRNGDRVQFGISISRGADNFLPTKLEVGINHTMHDDKPFCVSVPDGSDAEMEDESENESGDASDVWSIQENNSTTRIETPAQSSPVLPSPKPPSECQGDEGPSWFPSSPKIDLTSHASLARPVSPVLNSENGTGAGQIPLPRSVDIPSSQLRASAPPSEQAGHESDDARFSDLEGSDDDSLSSDGYDSYGVRLDNASDSGSDSDHDSDSQSGESEPDMELDAEYSSDEDLAEDQQPLFIYENDSDGSSDEDDHAEEQTESHVQKPGLSNGLSVHDLVEKPATDPNLNTTPTHVTQHTLPSPCQKASKQSGLLDWYSFSHGPDQSLQPVGTCSVAPPLTVRPSAYTLPSILNHATPSGNHAAERQPSPSDAAMPRSYVIGTRSEPKESEKTVANVLGEKTGKFDYFAAREENKMAVSRTKRPQQSSMPIESEEARENETFPDNNFAPAQAACLCQDVGLPTSDHTTLLASGLRFLTTPPGEYPLSYERYSSEDAAMTSASIFHQHKMSGANKCDKPPRRVLGIRDIVENTQSQPRPADPEVEPDRHGRSKRKAEGISVLNAKEKAWEISGEIPPVSVTGEHEASANVSDPPETQEAGQRAAESSQFRIPASTAVTSNVLSPGLKEKEGRPTKRLRRFAERVGFAALGGVTVGAMVFGTLIATAPTF